MCVCGIRWSREICAQKVIPQLLRPQHLLWLYRLIREWQSLLQRIHMKTLSPDFAVLLSPPPPITILPGSKSPFLLFSLQCKSRFQPERSLETSSPFSMSFSSLLVSFTNRRTYGILPCFAVAVRGRWSFMKEPRLPMQNVFHLYATDVI